MDDDDKARLAGAAAGLGVLGLGYLLGKGRAVSRHEALAIQLARKWGAKFKVPAQDALAIMGVESSYDPSAENHSERAERVGGAWGLMQLIPGTAADLVVLLRAHHRDDPDVASALTAYRQAASSLLDANLNAMLGTYYLARLESEFNGDFALAAAAYQQGPGRVRAAYRDHGAGAVAQLSLVAQGYVQSALEKRARIAEQGVLA